METDVNLRKKQIHTQRSIKSRFFLKKKKRFHDAKDTYVLLIVSSSTLLVAAEQQIFYAARPLTKNNVNLFICASFVYFKIKINL